MAKLQRLKAIAEETNDAKMAARVQELIKKEIDRHIKRVVRMEMERPDPFGQGMGAKAAPKDAQKPAKKEK